MTLAGPTLAEFELARQTVGAVARVTPVETSGYLSGVVGQPVLLKCEQLQRTGSFKVRGAYNRLAALSADERLCGVVAASAGNHAQGVAYAARKLGIKARIYMPTGVAIPKLEATRAYGAEVELAGDSIGETIAATEAYARESGAIVIPPYDNPQVIAGQGTLGLEIIDQVPEVETVIVGIGGGGLAAGVASAIKQRMRDTGRSVRIVGVQAENAAPYPISLRAGSPQPVPVTPTIADGIAVYRPGDLPFQIIKDTVDDIVTVSDDDIAKALLMLMERAKLVVEPAGAVPVAALLAGVTHPVGATVAVLSGGNIDPLLMQQVIAHGLGASDRYLTMSIGLPDRPGQLSEVSRLLAEQKANVVEVQHTRHHSGLQISEVELRISIETRGAEHKKRVVRTLRAAGFKVRLVAEV